MTEAKKLKTITPAQYAFLQWLYTNHPNVAQAAEEHRTSLNGFMDSLTSVFNNVVDKAPDLLKSYVAGKEQLQTIKLNIERAKAGQYPIDAGSLTGRVQQAASGVPWWAWGAAGALVVYLLVRK